MGELHLEITTYRIEEEQNIKVKVSEPIVVYREAINETMSGMRLKVNLRTGTTDSTSKLRCFHRM